MLEIFVLAYCLYFALNIYTSFMQIAYVQKAKKLDAIILEKANYDKAGNYSVEKEKINILSTFYEFIIFICWISFGLSILDDITSGFNNSYIIKAIVFIDLFIIINWLLSLPFEIYVTFKLDKKYEFSNMTLDLFIKDTMKTGALFLIFGSIVIGVISYIIDNLSNWWIWGFIFIFLVIILINMLYPIIRDKMFDKFEKLKDLELENKIESLLSNVGFNSSGIFCVDASKRDNRLNAYFGGLGSTKRVVLYDTLVEKLTHNELLAVLGHELGHFKNGDILKNIGIMAFIMFVFFAIFGNLPQELFLSLSINNEAYGIIAVFLIFSPIFSFFLMPLISLISRHNEYKADEFGSNLQSKEDLVNALLKLANENKSFPLSHPLYIFFYYSHPPLVERFKELGYDVNNISSDLLKGAFNDA